MVETRGEKKRKEEAVANMSEEEGAEARVNTGESDLARILQMMLAENQRRDERLADMASRFTTSLTGETGERGRIVQVVPDLDKGIEMFSGEGGESAVEWIERLEGMRALHEWSEALTLEVAPTHLTGAAKQWYRTVRRELVAWVEFSCQFKETFGERTSLPARWKRMEDRVQRKGENLSSYFHEKMRLCGDLSLSFEETKEQVIIGLWSKDMATTMLAIQQVMNYFTTW